MTNKILKRNKLVTLLTLLLSSFQCLGGQSTCNGKHIIGNFERVLLADINEIVEAKIDSGADMSSLSASHIKEVKQNNQTWLNFNLILPKSHKNISFSAPLVGYTRILKRKVEDNNHKEVVLRPVILMNLCFGNTSKIIKVNLTDRTHFKYPMLIGIEALKKFDVVIDISKKFASTPKCRNKDL